MGTGADYLRQAQESNGDKRPDVIILDLNMPLLNGMSTLKEIKKKDNLQAIPIFILTTTDDQTIQRDCEALGYTGFFTKTANIRKLRSIIETIVQLPPRHQIQIFVGEVFLQSSLYDVSF